MHRRTLSRRGAAAIEFALWLPILMAFLSAVIDWGDHWNKRVIVARAVMEGTRTGAAVYEGPAVLPPGSRITNQARERTHQVLTGLGMPCPSAACTVQVTWCPDNPELCGGPPLQALQVRIQYAYIPIFGRISTPTHITERFLMGAEYQRAPVLPPP